MDADRSLQDDDAAGPDGPEPLVLVVTDTDYPLEVPGARVEACLPERLDAAEFTAAPPAVVVLDTPHGTWAEMTARVAAATGGAPVPVLVTERRAHGATPPYDVLPAHERAAALILRPIATCAAKGQEFFRKHRAAAIRAEAGAQANEEAMSILLSIDDWRAECLERKARIAWDYDAPGEDVYAPALLKVLSEVAGDGAIVACDVGQHQMWVAQHCRFARPENHLSSGGLGTMGFGLPAAIGAKLGHPSAPVILVTGDGSIMMNLQELATLSRYGLGVKIVLLDNQALGLVRQWQELFFDGRFSEVDLSDNPDFVRVAGAFGIPAIRIERRTEVRAGIEWLLATDGPALAHVPIDPESNVWPLVPPGSSNATMLDGSRP